MVNSYLVAYCQEVIVGPEGDGSDRIQLGWTFSDPVRYEYCTVLGSWVHLDGGSGPIKRGALFGTAAVITIAGTHMSRPS